MMDFDFTKDIFLENERASLAPLQEAHYDALLPIALQDKSLLQFSPTPIHSEELLLQYIQTALQERAHKMRYPFVIFDKQQGIIAGSTSFAAVSNKDKRLEIGWTWIGKNFQRTGLNRNCKFLLLQYAFETLEFERVELKTDERNQQSRTAIEKLGGKWEGTLRSHTLMQDGFRRSTVYYSLLKDEWPAAKERLLQQSVNGVV